MTLTQMEYILAVEKFRHFHKAAKACHISQPTLSMQVQKAEESLKIVIFDRSKAPILPTPEGVKVIEQIRKVIKEYRKIFDLINEETFEPSGEFRLGVIPTLAPYLIPLFITKFAKKYPKVNLIVEEFKTEEIVELLEKDELDAGLLVTPISGTNFIERVLFHESFYIFASKGHELLKVNKIKEKDLSGQDVWLLKEGHCLRQQVVNVCKLKEDGIKDHNLIFEGGNLETLKNLVKQGVGYTILPELAVMNLTSEEKKLVKEFQAPIPTREVSLVHNRIYLKEQTIKALEEMIIASLPASVESHKNKKIQIIPID